MQMGHVTNFFRKKSKALTEQATCTKTNLRLNECQNINQCQYRIFFSAIFTLNIELIEPQYGEHI